jgi:hypothetical protein
LTCDDPAERLAEGPTADGLDARADAGEPIDKITSVASFLLSRIDTKIDARLPEDSPLRGQITIASARAAYQRYPGKFAGDRRARLEARGAGRQLPLWASTGTKNPTYSDVRLRRGPDWTRRDQHDARANLPGVSADPRPSTAGSRR